MKASTLMVKALENEGVQYIFAVPGEENLDLIESIRQSSITLITTRHEQEAGFMAATWGRLTGKTGVCLSTLGPGATNLVTAAAYAQLGAMPMMMITGQKPIKTSKQGKFQIIDVVDMMLPLTKFTKQIVHGSTIPALVRKSFRIAMRERPGAVHLELPEDIAHEESEAHFFDVTDVPLPTANTAAIKQAISLINEAKRPLLLIGAAANRQCTAAALNALVKKTKIPFFNTQMGKGVIDERNPLFMGTAALSEGDFVHSAINCADLIINVGHDIVEKPPFVMNAKDNRKVIHINFLHASLNEIYFPQVEVIGNITNSIDSLTDQIIPDQTNWDLSIFKKIKHCIDANLYDKSDDNRFPLLPQRIVADVRAVMPEDGILTLDNGMYKIWFSRNYQAYQPNTILLDNALATMGAGLPSGIAVSILHPQRKVVAICGDGGFMMNAQALETAVRLNVNLVIMILQDNAYGMIKWKQDMMGFKSYGLDFKNPDFIDFAKAHGATGYRIESTADFKKILNKALEKPGVQIIDVPIDYSETLADLSDRLKQQTCQIAINCP